MKPKFSIRSLLVFVAVISVFLIALMTPNRFWNNIISIGTLLVLVLLIPVMVGAQGKLRLQMFSFMILCGGSLFVKEKYPETSLIQAQSDLISVLDEIVGSSTNLTPTGARVERLANGYFRVRRSPSTGWKDISKTEIDKLGWNRYVIDYKTGVDSWRFQEICQAFIALLFGYVGSLITGWVYDKRDEPDDCDQAES